MPDARALVDASGDGPDPPAIEYHAMPAPVPGETLGRSHLHGAARSPGPAPAVVTAGIRACADPLLTVAIRAEETMGTR